MKNCTYAMVLAVSAGVAAAGALSFRGGDPAAGARDGAVEPVSVSGGAGQDEVVGVASRPRRMMIGFTPSQFEDLKGEFANMVGACFDPASPPSPEMMETINAMHLWGQRYFLSSRWSGAQGTARALTWSFVPDGLNIPNGIGEGAAASELFSRMDSLFAAQGGRARWITQFQLSFDRWQALTGLSYTRIAVGGNDWDDGAAWGSAGSAGLRGDVRISMKNIDGGGGVLAYNSFPGSGGDMVIDRSEGWGSSTNSFRFLRNTIMHEHGHGIGINHVCSNNSGQLMEPFLATTFDGPQHDEIRAGQRHYGDPYEPNDTAATATPMGTFGVGSNITFGTVPTTAMPAGTIPANSAILSIDANGKVDWYGFSITRPVLATISVIPRGFTYDNNAQAANGSCPSGSSINSLAQANLAFQLTTSTGGTLIAEASSAAIGETETLSSVLLGPAGDFRLRVYETDAPTQSQLYLITLVSNGNPTLTASDGAFEDKVAIAWTAIPNATGYQVYRNTVDNSGTAVLIGSPATNAFDDTTASPGVTYYYWARAFQFSGPARELALPDTGFRATPANQPPVANAGPDQSLNDADGNGSEPVALDGTGSFDPDGSITNYTWKDGPTTIATGPLPTANVVLPVGARTITLTVTDNAGATANDTVLIDINGRPVADAGGDEVVNDEDYSGDEVVTLDGSGSTDDGTIATYTWRRNGNIIASGASETSDVLLPLGVHLIELTVTDTRGLASAPDTVVIQVNARPTADAGPDQSVDDADNSGDEVVTLDGSGSNDPDGVIVTYTWREGFTTLASGPSATANVAFTVGVHVVELIVTDDNGATASDTVTITVTGTPACPADFNDDGFVDFFDLDAYVECFEGGGCPDGRDADFNGDGFIDFFDLDAFVEAFEIGC
ncbi:MAG: matrixin family metalloprotease [Phycisphaeraceae bacterium]|nr:MAG: matrixin family metalloprotease [Phycisphaeraceae bacterium]